VYDPLATAEENVRSYVADAQPMLQQLGLNAAQGDISFYTSASEAVQGYEFVQECAPEQLAIKHQLYGQIEDHLLPHVIVASSASGLMVTEMQQGWSDPSRFILGHPFNPPHLIPLVELVANDKAAAGVLESAEAFYKQVGKVTIRVNREVPAHVANRLQAALWKEAIHLVATGVASVEDVDKAVWAGPGLRWAAMGPHMLFNLGAGEGGMEEFCRRYADSFQRWWGDLGDVQLDAATIAKLVSGVQDEAGDKPLAQLASERDALIVNMLNTNKAIRD
jgi:3-hydroxybutyryl-CoA dehydrogenase